MGESSLYKYPNYTLRKFLAALAGYLAIRSYSDHKKSLQFCTSVLYQYSLRGQFYE